MLALRSVRAFEYKQFDPEPYCATYHGLRHLLFAYPMTSSDLDSYGAESCDRQDTGSAYDGHPHPKAGLLTSVSGLD